MGCCASNGDDSGEATKLNPDKETEEKKSPDSEAGASTSPTTPLTTRYLFKKTLGKGASCRVVEAVDKSDKTRRVAIKIMSKEKSVAKKLYNLECKLLTQLSKNATEHHQNVIKFLGAEEDEYNYYILTQLCSGGELFDRIVSKNPKYIITEKKACQLIRNMFEAIKFCHDHNIAHRDLKPENFVMQNDDPDAAVVLIDFGCGSILEDNNPNKTYDNLVGTAYYLAPELAYLALSRSPNTELSDLYTPMVKPRTAEIIKATDVWSLGVIAYVMMTGRAPFRGGTNSQIFESIVTNKVTFPENDVRYKTPLKLSPTFKDFLEKVLQKDPMKRPSMEDCIAHPWVQGKDASEFKLNVDVMRYLQQFNYECKLKKAITRVLAANMTREPEAQVKRHFVRLDADGDGHLDEEELTFLLLDMGYAAMVARAEAQEMVHQADINNDGVIDFSEFKAIWYRKILSTNEQYIHRVFNVFDENGDGKIDVNELKAVLAPEAPPEAEHLAPDDDDEAIVRTLDSLNNMIAEVDDDGDNMISFQEFKKAMHEDMNGGRFNIGRLVTGGDVVGPASQDEIEKNQKEGKDGEEAKAEE